MKHLLMHPAFPDIVGELATPPSARKTGASSASSGSTDTADPLDPELADPLFMLMAEREIAATRLW